jgi:hypothetical protein
MTITTQVYHIHYVGNGSTAVFSYPFKVFEAGDLEVVQTDTATAVATTLVLTTDYSVTGVGVETGGTITLVAGVLAVGQLLTIRRRVDLVQEAVYTDGDSFPAQAHEDALDYGVMIDQQLQEELDRSIHWQEGSTKNSEMPENLTGSPLYVTINAANTALMGTTILPTTTFDLNWLDVKSYSATGNLDQTAINATLAANPGGGHLYFGAPCTITTPTDLSGFTIADGVYKIFSISGAGAITLGPQASLDAYANWWGLTGDGTTDNSAALQGAFTGLDDGGKLSIASDRETGEADYSFDTTLTRSGWLYLKQMKGVKLTYTGTGDGIDFSDCQYSIIEEPYIVASVGATQAGAGLNYTGCGHVKVIRPMVLEFQKGIVIDADSAVSSMYGSIENPVIDGGWESGVSSGVGLAGIHFTGDSATFGRRYNAWKVIGGSIYGMTAAGAGIECDTGGVGLNVHGCAIEDNAGYAFRFTGDTNYRSDGHRITGCWIENNLLGTAYFGAYATNTIFEGNLYRYTEDRKFVGPWASYNIIRDRMAPTAWLTTSGSETHLFSNFGRGMVPYNNPLPNLMPNGAFLLEDPEWLGMPLGWSAVGTTNATLTSVAGQVTSAPASGAVWQILSATPPDGFDNYLRITVPTGGGNGPRVFRRIKVKPGRLYHVGCWVRSSVAQKGYLMAGTTAGSENYYLQACGTAATTDTWEYVSSVFLVPGKGAGAGPPADLSDADVLTITLKNIDTTAGTTVDFAGVQVNAGGIPGDYQECERTYHLPLRQIAHNYATTNDPSTHADGAGETIRTFIMPAGIMGIRGIVDITYSGYTTGTAGNHTIACKFGSLTACTMVIAEATEWLVKVRVENITASVQRISVLEVKGIATPVFLTGGDLYQAGAVNTAAAVTIATHGIVANTADYIYATGITVTPVTPWFDQSDGAAWGL